MQSQISAWASEGEHTAHWWWYSDKFGANEHIIDELPPPNPFSDLGIRLRARDVNFEPMNPLKIVQLPRFNEYIDRWHYEVFVVVAHLRRKAAVNQMLLPDKMNVGRRPEQRLRHHVFRRTRNTSPAFGSRVLSNKIGTVL